MDDQNNNDDENGLRFVNPPRLYNPAHNGYSHLAVVPAGYRLIFSAAQDGAAADEKMSDDFATPLRQALANVETVLKAANAKMSDVVKFTILIVDRDKEKFRIIAEEFERIWGDRKPVGTLIPVPALALEKMLVEIDVIAVVPE